MKKLFLGLAAIVMFGNLSFAQQRVTTIVTQEEYKTLDKETQRMTDYINSAIASLYALENNGKVYSDYSAEVHFSTNEKDTFKNSVIVSLNESGSKKTNKGSCQICGVSSAYSCVKKIKSAFAGQSDYDLHVHNDGNGCVTVSW